MCEALRKTIKNEKLPNPNSQHTIMNSTSPSMIKYNIKTVCIISKYAKSFSNISTKNSVPKKKKKKSSIKTDKIHKF